MPIWKQAVAIGPVTEQQKLTPPGTLGAHLGLRITEIGEDFLRGTLPVDQRTKQPYGRLHGGASCVLAEELGSFAAALCTDPKEAFVVGLDINANHIRGVTGGIVTGTARPLHIGRATQVWEIRIEDEQQKLVCISRLTLSVVKLSEGKKA
jgi:1,4-dihydroxy-2-naphthoyl-CoA hydrolase